MNGRFVSYYRVSTKKQGADGLGVDAQKTIVARYLNGGDWELLGEFTEVESGKLNDRPELAKAIALCKATGSRLLIAKLDRLARNVAFLANLMESGIDFVACDMPDANTLTIHILAAVAQAEREATSTRTKAALGAIKDKLDRGEVHVSKVSGRVVTSLGNVESLTKHRTSVAGNAKKAAKADAFAAKFGGMILKLRKAGESFASIAATLNEMGQPSPRGGQWTPMTVKRVHDRVS